VALIDPAFSFRWIAKQARCSRQASMDDVSQQLGELLGLVVSQTLAQRHVDMKAAFTGCLAKTRSRRSGHRVFDTAHASRKRGSLTRKGTEAVGDRGNGVEFSPEWSIEEGSRA
jgi:hypothetical protein